MTNHMYCINKGAQIYVLPVTVPQVEGKGEIKEGNAESGKFFFFFTTLFREGLYQFLDSNKHGWKQTFQIHFWVELIVILWTA